MVCKLKSFSRNVQNQQSGWSFSSLVCDEHFVISSVVKCNLKVGSGWILQEWLMSWSEIHMKVGGFYV